MSQDTANSDNDRAGALGWIIAIAVLCPIPISVTFVLLKLFHVVSWSWFAVFSPVLAALGLMFLWFARFGLEPPQKSENLPPGVAREKEKEAFLGRQQVSAKSGMLASWIFSGFWHWLFGETTGTPLWWRVIYWTVQIGSILLGWYLLWRGLREIDDKYGDTSAP